jgi:hypothetical protein
MITAICILVLIIGILLATSFSIKFKDGVADKNAWYAKLFMFSWQIGHEYYLPKNICSYFWKNLLGILLLPITLPYLIISTIIPDLKGDEWGEGDHITKGIFTWLLIALTYIIGLKISFEFDIQLINWYDLFIPAGLGLGFFICVALVVVGIVALYHLIVDLVEKLSKEDDETLTPYKPKSESILVTRFKNWKEKSCTTIKWK